MAVLAVVSTALLMTVPADESEAASGNASFDSKNLSNLTATISGGANGTDVVITLTASSGYGVPDRSGITLTANKWLWGTTTISSFSYSHDSDRETGTITISASTYSDLSTSEINITASALKAISVTISATTDSSTTSSSAGTVFPGDSFSGTLPSMVGYDYPESITVRSNSSTISSTYVSYSSTTGRFTISSNAVTSSISSITVSATYVAETYTVSGTVTNGSYSYSITPTYGQSLTITIKADNGYALPSSFTVTNGSNSYTTGTSGYSYSSSTGVLTISKVAGNVTISATCGLGTYKITYYDGTKVLSLSPSTYTYKSGCTLPTDVTKDQYVFVGWKDSSGNYVTRISASQYGDVKLYAEFEYDMSLADLDGDRQVYQIMILLSIVVCGCLMYVSRK